MTKYIVDIKGEIEGDYEIIESLEDHKKKCRYEYKDFAKFVAKLIFDEYREVNWKADDEILCRKLYKLGIIEEKDGNWVYTEEGDK